MAGNFQDGRIAGKIQYGPPGGSSTRPTAWTDSSRPCRTWGSSSQFIGMTTDSRSFLSYPRHEYFRRLLCQILGREMDRASCPTTWSSWAASFATSAIATPNATSAFGAGPPMPLEKYSLGIGDRFRARGPGPAPGSGGRATPGRPHHTGLEQIEPRTHDHRDLRPKTRAVRRIRRSGPAAGRTPIMVDADHIGPATVDKFIGSLRLFYDRHRRPDRPTTAGRRGVRISRAMSGLSERSASPAWRRRSK